MKKLITASLALSLCLTALAEDITTTTTVPVLNATTTTTTTTTTSSPTAESTSPAVEPQREEETPLIAPQQEETKPSDEIQGAAQGNSEISPTPQTGGAFTSPQSLEALPQEEQATPESEVEPNLNETPATPESQYPFSSDKYNLSPGYPQEEQAAPLNDQKMEDLDYEDEAGEWYPPIKDEYEE